MKGNTEMEQGYARWGWTEESSWALKYMQMEAAWYLQGLLAGKRALLGEEDSFWSSSCADALSTISRKSPLLKGIVLSAQQIMQLNRKKRLPLGVQFIRTTLQKLMQNKLQAGTSRFFPPTPPFYRVLLSILMTCMADRSDVESAFM